MWNNLFGSLPTTEYARDLDQLFAFVLFPCLIFVAGVLVALLCLCLRNSREPSRRSVPRSASRGFLILWTLGPLVVVVGAYLWSARLHAKSALIGGDEIEIKVTANQWMWSFQQPDGRVEMNALHVPVGYPVRLRLSSRDVLHSLSLPSFRLQQDAVPGRETELSFRPLKEGSYPLACTEFCGVAHSSMSGRVYVLDPITYEHWVSGDSALLTPVEAGGLLFDAFRCASCHQDDGAGTGPSLVGSFGQISSLDDGSTIPFDLEYVRESLLEPKSKLVSGYQPVMPSYKGQLDESQIAALGAFLESLAEN